MTVWLLTLAAPYLDVRLLLVLAGGSALGAAAVLSGGRGRAGASVTVACLAALTVTGGLAAARAQDRLDSPLTGLAGRVVEVRLELDDDPRVLTAAGGPRALVRGSVTAVEDRAADGDDVLLFGPADEWTGLLPGQTVRLRAAVRAAGPADGVVAVLSARSPPEAVGSPGGGQLAAGSLRSGLVASAARTLPARPAGLLPGLVVGDTSAMDPELTAEFRRAGLAHLTAVSGANVS
ncbi:ComEC/Rec2 family competence protein [uncultured Modestobacter sp.]|uniref:ComEC/Rec2 family competence protein n=1 Tax=uncultured Modestobacter sp. TaxID=380048 RepID=UPI0026119C18|nr:ComEC/Rec2 family competence protein [uncultured Modestobacter sp.]